MIMDSLRSAKCFMHKNRMKRVISTVQKMCHSTSQTKFSSQESIKDKNKKLTTHGLITGQPTPETHPHLVGPGEITSGISRNEYMNRRQNLLQRLCQSNQKHNVVIMPSSPQRYMIDEIPYIYRQDTDMLYMSGCLEQDCVLLMHTMTTKQAPAFKTVMFTPKYDPSEELWHGPRTASSDSGHVWGVDEGLPMTELASYLVSLDKELLYPNIWYQYMNPINTKLHKLFKTWISSSSQERIQSYKYHLHALRLIKSPAEIELMRRTCKISADSITATMKHCRPPITEHELFATVDYQCRMRGAERLSYPPVIAGGTRANIIHYINNNQVIEPEELVLVDAGSEYRGYSGDITRTWPVNGKFLRPQRDLYEAVLEVQKTVLTACAKHPSLDELFTIMSLKLGKVLQELSILPASDNNTQLMIAAYGFCPHHVSHYLGMDVHDSALAPKNKPIQPGSIITVEPGVYINSKNSSVPPRYLGIGIRLEDDVLITEDGYEVLSSDCPKDPDEIEAIVGSEGS